MKGIDAEHTRSSLGICTSEASSWEDGDGTCETQVAWSRQTSSRETYMFVLALLCVALKDFLSARYRVKNQQNKPASPSTPSTHTRGPQDKQEQHPREGSGTGLAS